MCVVKNASVEIKLKKVKQAMRSTGYTSRYIKVRDRNLPLLKLVESALKNL